MRFFYFFLISLALFSPIVTRANISFTEIMYDLSGTDTNREWVEVCAFGESVDISEWKFNDGANHSINEPPENGSIGSTHIEENSCAVLAANAEIFLGEHTAFSGTILDTVMSLNNAEETVSLIDESGNVKASASYTSASGGSGTGESLQLSGDTFLPAEPTPGVYGEVVAGSPTGSGEKEEQSDGEQEEITVKEPAMTVQISLPRIVIAGVPLAISPTVYGYSGDLRTTGYFSYNFGDGSVINHSTLREPELYTYLYPGEYLFSFEYRMSEYEPEPIVSVERPITVLEPGITIDKILPDGAVVLKNAAEKDIDIEGFRLTIAGTEKIFSGKTVIRAKKTITIPALIKGASVYQGGIQLIDPSGKELAVLPEPVPRPLSQNVKSSRTTKASSQVAQTTQQEKAVIPPKNLVAQSRMSEQQRGGRTPYLLFGSLGVAFLGAGGFLYLSRSKKEDTEASAYNITEIQDP